MTITVETFRQVWDDEHGVCIQVGPSGDGLDLIRVHTPDAKSKEWFGAIDFTLTPEMAKALVRVLTHCSSEIGRS